MLHPEGGFAFRAFDELESVEFHNNVIYRESGPAYGIMREEDAKWIAGSQIHGTNNWVNAGTKVPSTWSNTLFGKDPGFSGALQYTPKDDSTLVNSGDDAPASPAKYPFPTATPTIQFQPSRQLVAVGAPMARPKNGKIDIGAFENSSAASASKEATAGSGAGLQLSLKKKVGIGALGALILTGLAYVMSKRK